MNDLTYSETQYGLGTRFTHTINGRAETSDSFFSVINPSVAEIFAHSPDASRQQLDHAVAAARQAFYGWSQLTFENRRLYLHNFAAAIRAHVNELATLLTKEQGKPLAESLGEISSSANSLENLSDVELRDEVLREDGKNRTLLTYQPLGVVGGITPWNAPIALASTKIAQALYVGNTLIIKPSPYTPLTTLLLGEISREVLPPGVLNVIAGGNALGQWLTEHVDIDKISFTGSVATGKRVMSSAAGTLKRVTLELGGNDPAILLEDVDIDIATARIFRSAFACAGQICKAIKRVYVPSRLYEPVLESFSNLARNHRIGDGLDRDVKMGPLQNKMQYEKVIDLIEDARRQPGARIVWGGDKLDRPGYFISPTIIAGLNDQARLVSEEQFGPVLPVLKYDSIDDAIRRANDSRMALGASIWTKDIDIAEKLANRIEAGTIWINSHGGSAPDVPFGGLKESGLGHERGQLGFRCYMQARVIDVPVQQ